MPYQNVYLLRNLPCILFQKVNESFYIKGRFFSVCDRETRQGENNIQRDIIYALTDFLQNLTCTYRQ